MLSLLNADYELLILVVKLLIQVLKPPELSFQHPLTSSVQPPVASTLELPYSGLTPHGTGFELPESGKHPLILKDVALILM